MKIIDHKYELLTEVGKGGSATVYLARDTRLNKNWAVKEIKKNVIIDGLSAENSLLAEAELMKKLDHPSLPRIVDIIEEDDKFYIVMDYIEGVTLNDVLKEFGPQKQRDVIRWSIDILSIFDYLHNLSPPVIYRDMKPKNIILQPNGEIKLIDFGIARTYKEDKSEDTMALGTRGYAAPEQWRGSDGTARQSDARTDIYNLGMTMYELLTVKNVSKPPFETVPIRTINPEVSAGVENIIQKSINLNPDDRFQSAREMTEALLNYEKYDESYLKQQKKQLRRAILPFLIGAVLVVSSIVLFGVNRIMENRQYENLLVPAGDAREDVENIERAIMMKPDNIAGYDSLISAFTDDGKGINEEESEQILSIYNRAMRNVDKESEEYRNINNMLGEAYLVYFNGETDNSVRNKIISALPFFKAAADTETADGENGIARACVDLGEFYTEYILADTFIKAGAAEYEKLITAIEESAEVMSKYDNPDLCIILADIELNIIDFEKESIADYFNKNRINRVIDGIENSLMVIDTVDTNTQKDADTIMNKCADLKESIEMCYVRKERRNEE